MTYRKIYWTEHSKIKMRQYGFSKSKLLQLLYKPERKEKGIAPGTVALMSTRGGSVPTFFSKGKRVGGKTKKLEGFVKYKKSPGEIWLMYKDANIKKVPMRKIISAWYYPGISKPGEAIPIPDDIRQELNNI